MKTITDSEIRAEAEKSLPKGYMSEIRRISHQNGFIAGYKAALSQIEDTQAEQYEYPMDNIANQIPELTRQELEERFVELHSRLKFREECVDEIPENQLCSEMMCPNKATHIAYSEHWYNCEHHRQTTNSKSNE